MGVYAAYARTVLHRGLDSPPGAVRTEEGTTYMRNTGCTGTDKTPAAGTDRKEYAMSGTTGWG
jgi:hypothetical protein